MTRIAYPVALWLACAVGLAVAQDRDAKVRNDRRQFEDAAKWIYNDYQQAARAARQADKPLLVVFRCIP